MRTYTWNSAYCMFWEEKIGSLEKGKYADLVVWQENPITVDPDEMLKVRVEATMVNGEWVYKA